MNNEQLIEKMVRDVLSNLQGSEPAAKPASNGQVTERDYPLGEKSPERIKTKTGIAFKDLTLEKVMSGEIKAEDITISPDTLKMHGEIASSVNRDAFAMNLNRASELIAVPDQRILEIYDALRPYRSTKEELLAIADELDNKYGCKINAKFIRDAAVVYEKRGRLKK